MVVDRAAHNNYSPAALRRPPTRCGSEVTNINHYPIFQEILALNPRRIVWLDDLSRRLFPCANDRWLIFKARRSTPAPKCRLLTHLWQARPLYGFVLFRNFRFPS